MTKTKVEATYAYKLRKIFKSSNFQITTMLHSDYKFFLCLAPDYTEQQIFPINHNLEFSDEKDGLRGTRKLTTKLVFTNDENGNLFTQLLAYERSGYRCSEIRLRLECTFDKGVTYTTCFNGTLRCVDAAWDVSHCMVTFPVIEKSLYSCIYDNWEKEELIWYVPFTEVFLQPVNSGITFETQQINLTTVTDPNLALDPLNNGLGAEWTVISYDLGSYDPNAGTNAYMNILFGRVTFTGAAPPPSGTGWTNAGTNFWVRPMTPGEVSGANVTNSSFQYCYNLHWILTWFFGKDCWVRPNGQQVCSETQTVYCSGLNIISNFLSINPDGTQPNNSAYQAAIAKLNHLFLVQKSDVLRANLGITQEAKPKLSFKALMEDLKTAFNVDWWIEENPNYINPDGDTFLDGKPILRIEHISYVKDKIMLNLLQPTLLPYINGKQQYTTRKDKLPKQEVWKWQVETDKTSDFDGVPVTYNNTCTDKDSKEQIYSVAKMETNLEYLLAKIPSISIDTDSNEFEGFLLLAAVLNNEKYYASTEIGALSGSDKLNVCLSWANIQRDYHKYNRPLPQGVMNNVSTIFASSKRIRQQADLAVPMCRQDYFTFFNILHQAITQFGYADVEQAKYSETDQTLSLTTLF